jgi:iron complex transport system ATP-binding protein
MSNIIEVENLGFGFTEKMILKNISFAICEGRFIGVIGPNGIGKTTLLNLLCGILKPKTGSIKIAAKPIESYSIKEIAKKIAVVRQEFVPAFDFMVKDIVSMARTPYLGLLGLPGQQDMQIIEQAMESTQISDFANRTLASLSAGERQRVFIAKALAQDTPILLLDEPTNFLDMKHQVGLYDLLKNAQFKNGKTIIAITHDINLAAQYCDEILALAAGGSCTFGRTEDILTAEQIRNNFEIRVFVGKVGRENFFIPLGKFAKDGDLS